MGKRVALLFAVLVGTLAGFLALFVTWQMSTFSSPPPSASVVAGSRSRVERPKAERTDWSFIGGLPVGRRDAASECAAPGNEIER